jgi:hypothetical protein
MKKLTDARRAVKAAAMAKANQPKAPSKTTTKGSVAAMNAAAKKKR